MSALLDYCLRSQWGIEPGVMASMRTILDRHFYGSPLDAVTVEAITKARDNRRAELAYETVREHGTARLMRAGSVAVVPIEGVLARHASMVNGISQPQGMATTEIRSAIAQAIAEPWAKAIVLAVDSPGGAVDGNAELAEYIAEAVKSKPIHAVASGMMASCAYWLSAGATEIVVGRTSLVGSIGIMAMVDDTSEALKAQGVKRLAIKAGQYKAVGAPGVAVTEADEAEIERQLAATLTVFAGDVGKGRKLSGDRLAAVANGRVWVGEDALSVGLADRIGTLEGVISELNRSGGVAASGRSNVNNAAARNRTMSDTKIEAKTLAELKAEYPDQMKEHEEEVKASMTAPEEEEKPEAAATVAELKAAFPTDAAFAFSCLERGLSMSAALAERNKTLEAENASLKAAAPKPGSGAEAPKFGGGSGSANYTTYAQAVLAIEKRDNIKREAAMGKARVEFPALHAAWRAEGYPAVK